MNKPPKSFNRRQSDSQYRNRKSRYLQDNEKTEKINKKHYQQDQSTVQRLKRQRKARVQKQNYPENISLNMISTNSQFQKTPYQQFQNTKPYQKPRRYAYIKPGRQYSQINEQPSQRQRSVEQFRQDNSSSKQKNSKYDNTYRDRLAQNFSNHRIHNHSQSEISISRVNSFYSTKKIQNQRSSPQSDIYLKNSHRKQCSEIERIQQLQRQLEEQRNKFKTFQKQTIENQVKVLQTISNMEMKLKSVHQQNLLLKQKNSQLMKCQQQNSQVHELKHSLKQKQHQFHQLTKQHKKIKDIGRGIVQMMKKIDLIEVPQHQDQIKFAWRWLKKVVWEYEGIRKKAMQWKIAYEQLHQDSVDSQDN